MDNRVERLVRFQSRAFAERTVEAFGDVFDRDFVAERYVVSDVNRGGLIAACLQQITPGTEARPHVAVSVDENYRQTWHVAPEWSI